MKILIFTIVNGVENLLRFVGKVDGFLGKSATEEEIYAAISEVANGNSFISVSEY